jgi:hypothetical protein
LLIEFRAKLFVLNEIAKLGIIRVNQHSTGTIDMIAKPILRIRQFWLYFGVGCGHCGNETVSANNAPWVVLNFAV